jgi:hypothetical protein
LFEVDHGGGAGFAETGGWRFLRARFTTS